MGNTATLLYVHDPMCAWCWGYKPILKKLIAQLPNSIQFNYIVGGLAPDTNQPMPQAQRDTIKSYWQRIESLLGTEFNYDFWTVCEPRRSTYPACRAVLAAKQQGQEIEMLEAIQYAYYLRALNPSNDDTHYLLAEELHLDTVRFAEDYSSSKIEALLQTQLRLTRQLPISGFPSLVLSLDRQYYAIPIDYQTVETTLEAIDTYV